MSILKLSYKKSIKYPLIFIIVVFLFSNLFACHLYTNNFLQVVQGLSDDFHHSSNSCHDKKEILVEQNDLKVVFIINKVQNQDDQKLNLNFDFITSKKVPDLVRQKSPPFSSNKLDDSLTNHLSTIVKIE